MYISVWVVCDVCLSGWVVCDMCIIGGWYVMNKLLVGGM